MKMSRHGFCAIHFKSTNLELHEMTCSRKKKVKFELTAWCLFVTTEIMTFQFCEKYNIYMIKSFVL